MGTLKHTLFAEAADRHVFFVPNRRINLDWLLQNPAKLLPEGVFDALPDIAKYDLAEAGKCIAYSVPTGAAFHILRASEAVLRDYYCRIIHRNRVAPLTWGAITADFKKHRTKPSAEILENLDYIRRNFRNPTSHPEARFDLEEAQRLFQLCIDAIARIISDPLWTKSTAPCT